MIKIGGYGMSINLEKFINKKDTEQILIQNNMLAKSFIKAMKLQEEKQK